MPSAKDIPLDGPASFLLVGDSGTKKTTFLGTLPKPIYIFDFDKGLAPLAGLDGIEYDTFKEVPKGVKPKPGGGLNQYEWGTAWLAFLAKLNSIGTAIDTGSCPFKYIGLDSITTLSDIAMSYILKDAKREKMEIQDWQAYLNNMSQLFNQLTGWPIGLAVTAHIRRMENDLTKLEEKLPLIQGQFAGKIGIYFDEVYYTEVKQEGAGGNAKLKWTLVTQPSSIIRQAKSRKYNVPNGVDNSYEALRPFIEKKK